VSKFKPGDLARSTEPNYPIVVRIVRGDYKPNPIAVFHCDYQALDCDFPATIRCPVMWLELVEQELEPQSWWESISE